MARYRSVRRALVTSVAFLAIVVLMGLLVKTLSDWYGYTAVANHIEAFAELMRIIRPLIIFIAFCFWHTIVSYCVRIGVVGSDSGNRLVERRNRLFCWAVVLELSLGQGQIAIGVMTLIGILVYYRATNTDERRFRK